MSSRSRSSASPGSPPAGKHRARRRVLNTRLLIATLVGLAVAIGGSYFWRAYQVSRTAEAMLERARSLEKEGDTPAAIGYLQRYLQFHPEDTDAYLHLTQAVDRIALSQRQKRQAIALYRDLLGQLGKEEAREVRPRLAELEYEVANFAAARELAEQAAADQPENPTARRVLALSLYRLYRIGALEGEQEVLAGVGQAFEQALAVLPGNPELATTMARIWREYPELLGQQPQALGQTEREQQADQVIARMVEAEPGAETLLASYLYKSYYDVAGAEADLQQALALNPEEPEIWLVAAEARAAQGLVDQARQCYERAIELGHTDPRGYFGLARLWLRRRQFDRVVQTVRRCPTEIRNASLGLLGLEAEARIMRRNWNTLPSDQRETEQKEIAAVLAQQAAVIKQQTPLMDGPVRSGVQRARNLLEAKWAFARGQTDRAVELLETVALSHSDAAHEITQSVQAFELLAAIHASGEQWKEAAAAYERAVSLRPETTRLLVAAAAAWLRAAEPDKAMVFYRRALALDESPTTTLGLVDALVRREAARPAERRSWSRLQQSLAELGPLAELCELAVRNGAGARLKNWAEALQSVEGDDGCFWRYCEARALLAEAQSIDASGFAAAVQRAGEIRTQQPDWPPGLVLEGLIAEMRGQFDEAVAAYRQAEAGGEQGLFVCERLARLLHQLDRQQELDEYLAGIEERQPASRTLSSLAALRAVARGDTARAVELARQAVASRADDPAACALLAQALAADGRLDEAEEQFRAAVAIARTEAERLAALDGLFRFYLRTQQREQAEAHLRELAENRNLTEAGRSLLLARGYEVLGDQEQAETSYRRVAELEPAEATAQMALVEFLLRRGDAPALAEARQVLEQLLRQQPGFRPARRALALLLARTGNDADWQEAQGLLSEPLEGEGLAPADQRLQALLLARRGGPENRKQARGMLEKLLADGEEPAAGDRILLARLCEADGLLEEAQQQYQALVEVEEPNPADLGAYVEFLLRQGDLEAAGTWLERLEQSAPDAIQTVGLKARWLFARQEIDQIEPYVEQAAERLLQRGSTSAAQAALARRLAGVYRQVGRLEAACRWQQRLLATLEEPSPREIGACVDLLLRLGRHQEAGEWIEKLAAAAPDQLGTVALKARWLEATGQAEQIEETIEPVAEQRWTAAADDPPAQRGLALAVGDLYSSLDLHAAATRWYEHYRELSGAYEPLCLSLARQGRCGEAIRLCREAAQTDDSARPAVALVAALTAGEPTEDELSEAEPLLERALAEHADEPAVLWGLGNLRLAQGRLPEAIGLFEQLVKLRPNHSPALNNLAALLCEVPERRDEALKYVDQALRIAGPDPNLLDTKGTLLLRQGKPEEARPLLEQAVDASSEPDPRYQLHLAEACFRLGDTERALALLNDAQETGLDRELLTPGDQQALADLRASLPK